MISVFAGKVDGGVHPACAPHGCSREVKGLPVMPADERKRRAAPRHHLSPTGRCLGYCLNRTCYADYHGLDRSRVDCTKSNITTTARYVEQIYFGDPFTTDGAEQQGAPIGQSIAVGPAGHRLPADAARPFRRCSLDLQDEVAVVFSRELDVGAYEKMPALPMSGMGLASTHPSNVSRWSPPLRPSIEQSTMRLPRPTWTASS